MYTHIFLVCLGMTFRGVFPSIISPLTSFSSSQIADREQKCHVECKKLKVVYWHSLCLKCYGRQKKKNLYSWWGNQRKRKWMNEWMKSMLQQRWKKLQSCLLAQLIGHMCNRCHLSVSIVFIASLFLMAPFIHIHNWEQFKKEVFFYNVLD